MSRYFVYIVECRDETLYTGYTTDVYRRLSEHNSGVGAKYTRGRGPCRLVYCRGFSSKSEAMREEYRIKQLSRASKIELIRGITNSITNYNNVSSS